MGGRESHPPFLIRLLLREARAEEIESAQEDWGGLYRTMKENAVLVRSCAGLQEAGVEIPAYVRDAAAAESRRIEKTVGMIGSIGSLCAEAGLEHIFPKAFQHYPDMGHDVDLLVSDRSLRIDRLIADQYGAILSPGSLLDRVSGKTGGSLPGFPSPIEIHHGRMGHLGECGDYPSILLGNKKTLAVNDTVSFVPSAEDQVIIQAMQRIYGHFSIRITDAVHMMRLIRREDLDWFYIRDISRRIGISRGMGLYLGQLDFIHRKAFAAPLPIPDAGAFGTSRGKAAAFKGTYRVPPPQIAAAYLTKLVFYLRTNNWASAVRLSLLPAMAAISGLRALRRILS